MHSICTVKMSFFWSNLSITELLAAPLPLTKFSIWFWHLGGFFCYNWLIEMYRRNVGDRFVKFCVLGIWLASEVFWKHTKSFSKTNQTLACFRPSHSRKEKIKKWTRTNEGAYSHGIFSTSALYFLFAHTILEPETG